MCILSIAASRPCGMLHHVAQVQCRVSCAACIWHAAPRVSSAVSRLVCCVHFGDGAATAAARD
eukprot:6775908-Prymnesium_polylepis.1